MTQETPKPPRPHDIVGFVKAAGFLTPRMLVQQWGIRIEWAKELMERHYHRGKPQ